MGTKMKETRSTVTEALLFAGLFLVIHVLASALLEAGPRFDANEAPDRWEVFADHALRAVIAAAVATPVYIVLVSWYRKSAAKRATRVEPDER